LSQRTSAHLDITFQSLLKVLSYCEGGIELATSLSRLHTKAQCPKLPFTRGTDLDLASQVRIYLDKLCTFLGIR